LQQQHVPMTPGNAGVSDDVLKAVELRALELRRRTGKLQRLDHVFPKWAPAKIEAAREALAHIASDHDGTRPERIVAAICSYSDQN
jgi:hypothetical protein